MNIWIPKVKIIEPKSEMKFNVGVEGFFVMKALNRYGQVKRELRWKQLITNVGLDMLGTGTETSDWHARFMVGTGTTAPNFTDTNLVAQTNQTTASSGFSTTYSGGSPTPYWDIYRERDFGLGNVVANLTEVGAGGTSAGRLAFRDLIRDSDGNPTTFPVTADDQLRVGHILRVHPPLSDGGGTFTITGSGDHDYVTRIARPQQSEAWAEPGIAQRGAFLTVFDAAIETTLYPIGSSPTTGGARNSSSSLASYTPGSFYRDRTFTFGLTTANFAAGIGYAILHNSNVFGADLWATAQFQVLFLDPIMKFAGSTQRILTLPIRTSWARV